MSRAEEETAVLLAKKEAMEREISQISALAEDEKKEKKQKEKGKTPQEPQTDNG